MAILHCAVGFGLNMDVVVEVVVVVSVAVMFVGLLEGKLIVLINGLLHNVGVRCKASAQSASDWSVGMPDHSALS